MLLGICQSDILEPIRGGAGESYPSREPEEFTIAICLRLPPDLGNLKRCDRVMTGIS
jgi:hypothetical protein